MTSWGVTIGALSHGTVTGITVFWVVLYGGLFTRDVAGRVDDEF